jgi:hypothetical protein
MSVTDPKLLRKQKPLSGCIARLHLLKRVSASFSVGIGGPSNRRLKFEALRSTNKFKFAHLNILIFVCKIIAFRKQKQIPRWHKSNKQNKSIKNMSIILMILHLFVQREANKGKQTGGATCYFDFACVMWLRAVSFFSNKASYIRRLFWQAGKRVTFGEGLEGIASVRFLQLRTSPDVGNGTCQSSTLAIAKKKLGCVHTCQSCHHMSKCQLDVTADHARASMFAGKLSSVTDPGMHPQTKRITRCSH